MEIASAPLNKKQTLAFAAAWLGWTFDGLDSFLYSLVALPFVKELLGPGGSIAEATERAALIQAVFLVGWALGGAVFGRIGDRLGRSKTLTITILVYSICTGLSFFSKTWEDLMLFRFLAALGIGGEWAAGSSLVAETLPSRFRFIASATLQNGYVLGMIFAALTVGLLGHYDPRYVFLVGIAPAVVTLWIRRGVPEPEAWSAEKSKKPVPAYSELFRSPVLKNTLMAFGLAGLALTAIWALLFFSTQVILALPEVKVLAPADKASIVRHVTIVYCLWNILGNYVAGGLAAKLGYKWAFGLLFTGSLVASLLGFHTAGSLGHVEFWLSAVMFFGSGVFGIFPLYIPLLFPTLLRTAGAGLTYNFGRMTAAAGTLFGGYVAAAAGGPHLAIWYMGFLYLPAIVLAIFAPNVLAADPVPA